jgi:two-component system phosphate regulon response regulator PhoB
MKVLIVEDEAGVRDILVGLLEEFGFATLALDGASRIIEEIEAWGPDIVLLDQNMPGKSGQQALGEIRGHSKLRGLPVIMVTGLAEEDEVVSALELGADDYVTKPFSLKELAARIKALARRAHVDGKRSSLERGDLVMDFSAHRVTLSGQEILLTLTEFKILSELLEKSGEVLTRERLRESALGNLNVTDRTIDVHMTSLRKKLNGAGTSIQTVRGVGYRFSGASNGSAAASSARLRHD